MGIFDIVFSSKKEVNEIESVVKKDEPSIFFESDKIHSIIIENIMNAKESIHLAMARFTDETIFKEIVERSKTGVKVDIIVSDNDDNQKIDFGKINEFGGEVTKIPTSGYGSMNNKFMVIDRKIVLNGSYNYTINARKNNDENIQITKSEDIAEKFVEEFYNLKTKFLTPVNNIIDESKEKKVEVRLPDNVIVKFDENEKSYEDLLKLYIEGEINQSDDKELVRIGKEASENNMGDHTNLIGYFQSILYKFHDDATVSESKKDSLIMRLHEQKEREINRLNKKFEDFKENATITLNNIIDSIKTSININKNNIVKNENEIEVKTKRENVINEEKEIVQNKINQLLIDGLKLDSNGFQFNFAIILFCFVLIWILIFYTSVGYYLVFLEKDLEAIISNGGVVDKPGVVDFDAFQKLYVNHGFMAVIGCMSFVIVPLIYGIISAFNGNKKWNNIFYMFVIFIDIILSAKIIDEISKAEIKMGDKPEGFIHTFYQINENNYFVDKNFWLVLFLGTGTILSFKILYDYFKDWYDNKRPSIVQRKVEIELESLEKKKKEFDDELLLINVEIGAIKAKNKALQLENEQKELKIINERNKIDTQVINQKNQLVTSISLTEKVTELYIGKLKSGNYVLSMDVLRHRISKFLEGWSNFLFEHYAPNLANQKLNAAINEKNSWLQNIIK